LKLQFKSVKPLPHSEDLLNTFVFIDYEYLFFRFKQSFSAKPMLDEIVDDINSIATVSRFTIFGDFSKPELSYERNRIRTITNNIIDCAYSNESSVKDYTDFIMLDHIYQSLYHTDDVEQFIIITGDGHFSSVIAFIKRNRKKVIGVYGLAGSLHRQLCDCSTWAKEISVAEGDELEYQTYLLRNLHDAETKGKLPTFGRTVDYTQGRYGGDRFLYERVLRNLIDEGYVVSSLCTSVEGREFKMLSVNWERVREELDF